MIDPLLLLPRTPRQEALLALADELAARFAPRSAQHDREGSFPSENMADLVAARYHALSVPRAYGGYGATLLEAVLAQERLARGDAATALVAAMPLHMVGGIAETGAWPAAQFERICRAMVEEGALINSLASEPELGSPSRGGLPATTARQEGDRWLISGHKNFASGLPALTHYLISATLAGTQTVGVFLVRRDLPGLSTRATWDVLGMRATGSDDLLLEDVPVDDEDLLLSREPGAGRHTRGGGDAWFYLTVAAVYLGVGGAARDAAVAYARERKPTNLGGRPIASVETIQRRLGEIEGKLVSARNLLYTVADTWGRAPEQRLELHPYLGLSKVLATTSAVAAADLAMLVVGGAGMSRALPFERFIRDVRAGLFHPPTEDAALAALGRGLLGPLDP